MVEPNSHDMILGELRGQVRELVHSVNNLNGKFDALTREVIALGPLAADISEIKARVTKLETNGNQWTGARLLAVWVVGIAVSILAALGLGGHRP